jgi:hypothetical protein
VKSSATEQLLLTAALRDEQGRSSGGASIWQQLEARASEVVVERESRAEIEAAHISSKLTWSTREERRREKGRCIEEGQRAGGSAR